MDCQSRRRHSHTYKEHQSTFKFCLGPDHRNGAGWACAGPSPKLIACFQTLPDCFQCLHCSFSKTSRWGPSTLEHNQQQQRLAHHYSLLQCFRPKASACFRNAGKLAAHVLLCFPCVLRRSTPLINRNEKGESRRSRQTPTLVGGVSFYWLAKTTSVDYGRPYPASRTSGSTRQADVHAVTTWTSVNHWKQNQWIHKHKLHVRMLSPSLQRFSCSLSHLLLGKPLEHQTSGCTCHAQLDYVLLSIM